jgi:hypothetical protein
LYEDSFEWNIGLTYLRFKRHCEPFDQLRVKIKAGCFCCHTWGYCYAKSSNCFCELLVHRFGRHFKIPNNEPVCVSHWEQLDDRSGCVTWTLSWDVATFIKQIICMSYCTTDYNFFDLLLQCSVLVLYFIKSSITPKLPRWFHINQLCFERICLILSSHWLRRGRGSRRSCASAQPTPVPSLQ